jgi:hypothetical protein
MVGTNEMTRNLLAQGPGRVDCHVLTADTQIIAQHRPARHNGGTPYYVKTPDGSTFVIVVSSLVRWARDQLRKVGTKGCTPLNNPTPRMAAYVHSLRGTGVEIETITKPHEGDFPEHHARNLMRSGVSLGQIGGAA